MSGNEATFKFTVKDNSPEIKEALDKAAERALYAIGTSAERHAKERLRAMGAVDTGRLLNSINFQVKNDEVTIGTEVKYGKYVEFGTGKYASTGGGTSKDNWVYKDAQGNFHQARPQQPRPFIVPAVTEHTKEYRNLIIESLENA